VPENVIVKDFQRFLGCKLKHFKTSMGILPGFSFDLSVRQDCNQAIRLCNNIELMLIGIGKFTQIHVAYHISNLIVTEFAVFNRCKNFSVD